MELQEAELTNQIIYIMVMKICISNNVVEFDPSEKTLKENLYRGGVVLTLGYPLIIRLLNVYLQPWILKFNHITPSYQLTLITTISTNFWYKQTNNNPKYKDAEANNVSWDSYQATTWFITKFYKKGWRFADYWVCWDGSTY